MYICIYVYMYICIYVYMCICIYGYMDICVYVYMYIYVYMHICIYVYMFICIYVYIYTFIYVYVCTCMHADVCMCVPFVPLSRWVRIISGVAIPVSMVTGPKIWDCESWGVEELECGRLVVLGFLRVGRFGISGGSPA